MTADPTNTVSRQPRVFRFLPWLIAIAAVIIALAAVRRSLSPRPTTTLVSLSPSESHRVHLIEMPTWIDRNFEVRLEDMDTQSVITVFRSPDEGRPVGSERIIWSADGKYFLLIGKHFAANERSASGDGYFLYLMYDLNTGEIHCNATQQREPKPFTKTDIDSISWEPAGF